MPHDRLELTGPWRFGVSDSPDLRGVRFRAQIEPPAYPQLVLEHPPEGPAYYWYQRELQLPRALDGHQTVVRFGASDWLTDVWMDGEHAASNRGGYLPFEAVVPPAAHGRAVTVTVRVWDAPALHAGAASAPDGKPLDPAWIPRGKQHWYGECSGLWQPVWLIQRPATHATGLRTNLDADLHTVRLTVFGSASDDCRVSVEVSAAGGSALDWRAEARGNPAAGIELAHRWPDVRRWSPGAPSLYDVTVRLTSEGLTDERRFTTGFRRVEADERELRLNGAPLYLRGALDQDYSPHTGNAYPGDDALARRFALARDAGLDLVRCHVKLPDPRYLALADRAGLLVWYELPSWGHPSLPAGEPPPWVDADTAAMLRAAALRDAHHPALIARSVINEGWGLDLPSSAADRDRLRRWTALARETDPTRLVIDNSAHAGARHVDSDLADFHVYAAHPHGDRRFGATVDWLAARPPDLWERGDAAPPDDRPTALTEFGIWGLPDDTSPFPAWLAPARRWTNDPAFDQAGFAARFGRSAARRAFASPADLCAATRQVQAEGLRRQIGRLRRTPGLHGFVITELMDQGWEVNGLGDFHARPKPAVQAIRAAAAETVALVDGLPDSIWAGAGLSCRALLAGPRPAGAYEVVWRVDGAERRRATVQAGAGIEPEPVDSFAAAAPPVERAAVAVVEVDVRGPGLDLRASAELLVIPQAAATIEGKLRVLLTAPTAQDRISTLANALAEAGCTTLTDPKRIQAVVAAGGGAEAAALVRGGLPALVIADRGDTPFLPSIPREGRYQPHWSTAFDWIAPDVLPDLPTGPLMRAPFSACAPTRVIPALDGLDPDDVLMGTFRGWLGNEAAITAQAAYGKGRVVVTTLGLSQAGRADPLARALLVRLLQYAASNACRPTTRIL